MYNYSRYGDLTSFKCRQQGQFEEDEIVSTVERRGMIIGFKKDGTSCVLKNGKCV